MARKSQKGLPPYLNVRNGYFYYNNPKAGFYNQPMGRDRLLAISAARQLNAMAKPDVGSLVEKTLNPAAKTVKDAIDRFKEDILPNLKLGDRSKQEMGYRLNRLEKDIGNRVLDAMTVQNVAEYLDSNFYGDGYKQHRTVLSRVFRIAMTKGWCREDPAEKTLPTRNAEKVEKKRQRLKKEQLDIIYEMADPWLKIAIDLALITLQRRQDLVKLKFSDIKDGRLYLVQQKTKDRTECARLSIAVSPNLAKIINKARMTGIACPYIIHRKPDRRKSRENETKQHWAAVRESYLTRAFTKVRNKTGLFDNIPEDERPTFHELRSLGGDLYKKKGWSLEQVQSLMGHASEGMT
ncbi:tyrosine-type recombinase/integrase, partial [Sansalvadorimonas verongulae]|uniref:tyrosine-type recombinase/integrase n=1 Tax=Sansalvadorimonas verongulae TaxID=2172824 RepID=UPI0012BC4C1E